MGTMGRGQAPEAAQPARDVKDPRGAAILLKPHERDGEPLPPPRVVPEVIATPKPAAGSGTFSPALGQCPPPTLALPARGPRPPDEIRGFVEELSSTDGSFEVIAGEGRVLTLKEDIVTQGKPRPWIVVGDPSVADFAVVGPRQIRIIGLRLGSTDLSITTGDGKTYTFQVRVVADLNVLRYQLTCMFPDARLKLSQLREHVIVEGQARDTAQVARILEIIRAYLMSIQATQSHKVSGQSAIEGGISSRTGGSMPRAGRANDAESAPPRPGTGPATEVRVESFQVSETAPSPEPQIINLLRVVGSQQILLKVRIAELNRTAMRSIGADWLVLDPESGLILGTQIGRAAAVSASGTAVGRTGLHAVATLASTPATTLFGIFQQGDFEVFLRALRQNQIMKILAEPNLVTMHGQDASFLAGGEFPVPVPQVGVSGVAPTVTVQYKEFGVRLNFLPFILDGDVIRLTVDPEVSHIDRSLSTTLVAGGSPVPGLNSRKAHTTVELRQGQTLMIAGLLQLQLDGSTSRIPGLGDVPILGPFFSNTTHARLEKELVVLVTPYLVEPMHAGQVSPTPGDEVKEPSDLELYFMGRIEGRTGKEIRSTTMYDDPFHILHHVQLEKKHLVGPCGYSD
jgi:pilus assembly protein CpaC